MPRSRTLLRAHFWSCYGQTFFGWCKMTQILYQICFFVKTVKHRVYFFICLWKIVKGWSEKLEIWHAENLDPVLKKARKQQFYPGSRSLWILHLKYTNICQFFSLPGSKQNYLDSFFKGSGQLVPSIWFAAFLNRNWFFGNLTAAEICFQLIPKYKLKVKLQRR